MSEEKMHSLFARWYASEHDGKRPNRHGMGYCTPEEEDLWWAFRAGIDSVMKEITK